MEVLTPPLNVTGLRTSAEVETLIARTDAVLTTRLHGLVLALKNGVPALAVDPVPGGGKLLRQAETLEWPAVLVPESATDEALGRWLDYCLSEGARSQARACAERALPAVDALRSRLLASLALP